MPKDFLDEIARERTVANPDFPAMVDAAAKTRSLIRSLSERRQQLGLSQTFVAARMGTSRWALARLESGDTDPRVTALERYALAIGQELAVTDPTRHKVSNRSRSA
jgi:DNA-binding XRE family transcriptional regulator